MIAIVIFSILIKCLQSISYVSVIRNLTQAHAIEIKAQLVYNTTRDKINESHLTMLNTNSVVSINRCRERLNERLPPPTRIIMPVKH